jgi:endoglucanase
MSKEFLVGHSLDNRASLAALTHCLMMLKDRKLSWDVWAVATVQEEVSKAGAITSAFQLRPSLAVAIDVTFGSGPGSPAHSAFPFGECVTLGWGPSIHPMLHKIFVELCESLEIPWEMEPMPRYSGTDAEGLQLAAEGAPTMLVSIPLRYMHTPVEMVSMKDILRAGRLLAEFTAQLDGEIMQRLARHE